MLFHLFDAVTRTLDRLLKLSIIEKKNGDYSIVDPMIAGFAKEL